MCMSSMIIPYFQWYRFNQLFTTRFDANIIEEHKVPLLNVALQETLARWWGVHCNHLREWENIKIIMEVKFRQVGEYPQYFVNYRGTLTLDNICKNVRTNGTGKEFQSSCGCMLLYTPWGPFQKHGM